MKMDDYTLKPEQIIKLHGMNVDALEFILQTLQTHRCVLLELEPGARSPSLATILFGK